jgi:cytochrome P450
LVVNIVVGAHDTSTGQIACTLLTLLEHPDMHRRTLARRPHAGAGRSGGDDALRVEHRSRFPRVAIEAVDYDGLQFEAGALLFLCTDTANTIRRLRRTGPVPAVPLRSRRRAHRLMTFGAGPHYCLGRRVSRAWSCKKPSPRC